MGVAKADGLEGRWIEVFDAAGHGREWPVSADEVRRIAENYDPKFHEAPVKLDHGDGGPAGAWVAELKAEGTLLLARLSQAADWLTKALRSGAFKKRSVELYRDLLGRGPYLRAVALLGAAAPAVKGLRDVEFREDEGEYLEFKFEIPNPKSETNSKCETPMIETDEVAMMSEGELDSDPGVAAADAVDVTDDGSVAARVEEPEEDAAGVTEENAGAAENVNVEPAAEDCFEQKQEREVAASFAEHEAKAMAARTENALLRQELKVLQREREREEFERFLESQRELGKPVGAWIEQGVVDLHDGLGRLHVSFGEGDSSAREALRRVLESTPGVVRFGELAGAGSERFASTGASPREASLDSLELSQRAEAWIEEHPGASFAEALAAVSREV
ncbi:hypothetical protein JXA32_03040 [Candidatus Sumerlaeota bacterium]|nr:hypothetical protein [Candidatus Sumerlaeota bacterium]